MLQNNPEIKSKIDQLWHKLWSGGISNPLTEIELITYLMFMKRLDELDQKKQADAEWTGKGYISKFEGTWIPTEYRTKSRDDDSQKESEKRQADAKMYEIEKRTLRWSEFKRMQAEEMLHMVDPIKNRYQKRLAELEDLYSTLRQKGFKGELDLSRVPMPVEATTKYIESVEVQGHEIHNRHDTQTSVAI